MISKHTVAQGLDIVRDPMAGNLRVELFKDPVLEFDPLEAMAFARQLINECRKLERQLALTQALGE